MNYNSNLNWNNYKTPETNIQNENYLPNYPNKVDRIMDTTIIPQLSVADKNYIETLQNNGTNTANTCTGNNCEIVPETLSNTDFFPAYLKKFIGRWVRLDFFMGNTIEQRVGQLLEVGASYVLIKLLEPETIMMCDLYSIKFVTIILNNEFEKLFSF